MRLVRWSRLPRTEWDELLQKRTTLQASLADVPQAVGASPVLHGIRKACPPAPARPPARCGTWNGQRAARSKMSAASGSNDSRVRAMHPVPGRCAEIGQSSRNVRSSGRFGALGFHGSMQRRPRHERDAHQRSRPLHRHHAVCHSPHAGQPRRSADGSAGGASAKSPRTCASEAGGRIMTSNSRPRCR
jgi:hypothetical protein